MEKIKHIPIENFKPNASNVVDSKVKIESGWALLPECSLKAEHALWLDLNNEDSGFQTERGKRNWLSVVANDFATWLIKQLKSDEHYLLGDVEHAYFHKLCLHHLTRFERVTPVKGDF